LVGRAAEHPRVSGRRARDASPRGCAFALVTCCRRAVKLRSVASDPRVGGARSALVPGSRGNSSPQPSLGSRAPRGACAWARGFALLRGGAWRIDLLPLPPRGVAQRARALPPSPRGGWRRLCSRPPARVLPPSPRGGWRRLCLWPAAQDQAFLGIVSPSPRRRTRGPGVPPAEAGSRPCPVAHPPPRWWGHRRRRGGSGESVPASRDRRGLAGAEAPRPRAEALGRLGFGVRRPFCRGPWSPVSVGSRGCLRRSGRPFDSGRGPGRGVR
jgi:hypothetical protein